MHQQPPHAPLSPKSFSKAGQSFGESGRVLISGALGTGRS
jgi:hypothetical protein